MSTLFTVNQSWFNAPSLYEQLCFAQRGDSILLLEGAVLALQSPISLSSFLAKCQRLGVSVLALSDDCQLRGINSQYDEIELIDYAGFLELVIQHDKQLAW